jgi:hypothetical protein
MARSLPPGGEISGARSPMSQVRRLSAFCTCLPPLGLPPLSLGFPRFRPRSGRRAFMEVRDGAGRHYSLGQEQLLGIAAALLGIEGFKPSQCSGFGVGFFLRSRQLFLPAGLLRPAREPYLG